jgi:hypothetical protein
VTVSTSVPPTDPVERARWADAVLAIERLQSAYCHFLAAGRVGAIAELFAKDRDDITIEVNTRGAFVGRDAPERMYAAANFGAHKDVGLFGIHVAVNPMIDVDLAKGYARSVWQSPGLHTVKYGDERVSVWQYGKYYCEAVRDDDGRWRFLSLRWRLFFNSTGTWDRDSTADADVRPLNPPHPDAPPAHHAPYRTDQVVSLEPGPPEPY